MIVGAVLPIQVLGSAVGALAGLALEDFRLEQMLRRLCEVTTGFAVDGAGVMICESGVNRFVHASDPQVQTMELLQEALQEGPCREAIDTGTPVWAQLQEENGKWPAFAAAAAVDGIQTVLAVPLISDGRHWGVLDVYWRTAQAPDEELLATVQLLGNVAVSYMIVAAQRTVTRAAQEQLASRAMHDHLTGLPNRSLIYELAYHALAAAERRGTWVGVLFIDIDHFKTINDTLGHRVGDGVLKGVADRLHRSVRSGDSVARLGGDEFLVLCEDLQRTGTLTVDVAVLAERIKKAVSERPVIVDGRSLEVSISVGVAVTGDRPPVDELIHQADIAMYQAKNLGGDQIISTTYSTGVPQGRRALAEQVVHALEADQLRVHYQPIIGAGGAVVAVEALLRWQHPQLGLLPAADFIDLAESTGAVVGIGHWLICEAAEQLGRWQQVFPGSAPRTVFCNLSAKELVVGELPAVLAAAVNSNGLNPAQIGVEIVEEAFTDPRAHIAIEKLRAAGHPVAIDDFGSGYSSLARVTQIPGTHLKLDRTLIERLPADRHSQVVVDSVLTMATNLGLSVVIEGIETPQQAAYFTPSDTVLLQGYHLGEPMAGNAVNELLRRQARTAQQAPTQQSD